MWHGGIPIAKTAAGAVIFLHNYTDGHGFVVDLGTAMTACLAMDSFVFRRFIIPLYLYLVSYTVTYTDFIQEQKFLLSL